MSDFAQSVKQQADIVKVVEGYIRLRKAGAQNYTGLCPFHKEKSPSFSVHAVRQFYHCFGCHESGDVFSFVAKIENVTFPEAVRIVAQKCGIPPPKREFSSPEEAAEARLRTKLLELHQIATDWFEQQLASPEGATAREYLAGRGLDGKGIKEFRIGYAPDSFNALRDRLSSSADEPTLRASGLFSAKEIGTGPGGQPQFGPLYDRFRKRVMFPIANESGRVIAFTARLLGTGDGEKSGPKYLNSPETPLYSKSRVLFNLDKAKAAIRRDGFALLVEGQMDCISVYLRGIQNVIATSGTAMTEQQIAMWKRQLAARGAERVRVVANFDPDPAGQTAAAKTIDLLIGENFEIKIAILPGGLDPDRFVRERGVEAYMEAIRGAKRLENFLIERALQLFPGMSVEQRAKQVNYLGPFMNRMPEMLVRTQFARDISQKLGVERAVLGEELVRVAMKRQGNARSDPAKSSERPSFDQGWLSQFAGPDRDKNRMLSTGMSAALNEALARFSDASASVGTRKLSNVERVLLRALAITDPEHANVRRLAVEAVSRQPEAFEHLGCFGALKALAARDARDPMEVVEDAAQMSLVAEAMMNETGPPSEAEVASAIQEVEERALEARLREARASIAEAERRGDYAELAILTQRKLELDKALRRLQS